MPQLLEQRPPVRQAGQFVVVRVVARLLLGVDSRLELHQHRGDRLEGVDLGGHPRCRAKWRKPRTPHVVSPISSGTAAPATRSPPDPSSTRSMYSSVVSSKPGRYGSRRSLMAMKIGSASKDLAQRVGVGHVLADGPLGFKDGDAPDVVVAPDEGDVGMEELRQDCASSSPGPLCGSSRWPTSASRPLG